MKNTYRFFFLLSGIFLLTTAFARTSGKSVKSRTGTEAAQTAGTPHQSLRRSSVQYDITDYGAVGDSRTLNTKAIQSAIDHAAAKGAVLTIPKGIFLTGALFLKPGLHIRMKEGAVLKGSTDIRDYPRDSTRIEGHFEVWPSALLNGNKTDHIRITGPGTLDGSGAPFWKEFYHRRTENNQTTNLDVARPRLAFFQDARDIVISGIHFENSGFWNLHLFRCQQVKIESCRFTAPSGSKPDHHAPSSDGIDVDCSQDITIRDCFFSVGDDCIALKGNKGPFALQDKNSPAVERIHITGCIFEAGGGIVTCGSEATIVRDVHIDHCITRKPTVLRLKLRPDTPQQYENIHLDHITMEGASTVLSIKPWTQYFDLKGQQPPKSVVKNITIAHLKGSAASLGEITGNPTTTFGRILLKNADIRLSHPTKEAARKLLKDLEFSKVVINGQPVPAAKSGNHP